MESRAKFLGHPVHQMLIVLPAGLFVTAAVFDVVHLVRGASGPWATVSYWMIVAGIVGGLVAAVFGLVDYLAIPAGTRARRIGTMHGVGNVIVVALFAASWLLRRDAPERPDGLALACSFAGVALAAVTAWLGGELVDRLGVGVDDHANLNAPNSLSGKSARAEARR